MLLFCVCVTLSRYMKTGENLVNEVPVEKSILADFDQFIILVNKWKGKWVHEGYRKNPKISPGAHIFQRPFFEGLIYGRNFVFQNRLG